DISLKQFAKIIRADNLNSYEGTKVHPRGNYVYKTRIEINEPLAWYRDDASLTEQEWAREAALKHVLTQLVENEVFDGESQMPDGRSRKSEVGGRKSEEEWGDDY
ncbi:MAG: hypothetical protein ACXVB6_15240, partial [Mucilaginibacter sp.]